MCRRITARLPTARCINALRSRFVNVGDNQDDRVPADPLCIIDAPDARNSGAPVDISKPVIFVAHGFGGLIYEQALTMSYKPDDATTGSATTGSAMSSTTPKRSRKHAVLLLDTPHHGAGVADWAIVCAKRLRIPCGSTRQKQKWSSLDSQFDEIEKMQREFRRTIRRKDVKIEIYGCFAMDPMPGNPLRIAPEWTVLPDFHVLGIQQSHFGMTRIKKGTPDFERFCTALRERAKQLIGENVSKKAAPNPPMAVEMPEDFRTTDIHSSIVPAEVSESHSFDPVSGNPSAPKKLALLIASPFQGLRGPLNDVASMEAILKTQEFSISQCYGQNATRAGILAAWDNLIGSISSPHDLVMIYYSGHGGSVKNRRKTDHPYQCLVPMDFGGTLLEGNIRVSDRPFSAILDLEIAHLLHRMTQRTPYVTVIFDCSYSGRVTRSPTHPETAVARNLPEIYYDKLSSHISYLQSEMGYPEEPVSEPKSNENVVFIEAAVSGETAWEEVFDDQPMGAMTKALVSVLQFVKSIADETAISWQMIMQRVWDLVSLDFPRQNPRVSGPSKRFLFSIKHNETDGLLLKITQNNERNNMSRLKAGMASGLRDDNVYALMPLGEKGMNETRRIGTATIISASDIYSEAKLSFTDKNYRIPQDGVLGFLIVEAPIKWPVLVPDDAPRLLDDVKKSRVLRPTDPTRKERFLASFHRYEDNIILRTMQGVQIASSQVSDNDFEAWTKAKRNLVRQAEQLAVAHQLQTLVCDNQDQQLDHALKITLYFEQDMQGSIFEGTSVHIDLLNRGEKEVYVSVFFINVTGRIYELYSHRVAGSKELRRLRISWTEGVPKTKPIKEHLFFIITDVPVDLRRLETKSPEDESDLLDLSPYDQLSEALRKAAPKHSSTARYDTRLSTFNINPDELPAHPNLARTWVEI